MRLEDEAKEAKEKAEAEAEKAKEGAKEQTAEEKEKEEKEKREKAEEASSEDEKIPPPAEKLFELLYDEIEHRDITAIGVAKDNPLFVRGMELLRIHTAREIREAIDKTKQARELKIDVSMLCPGPPGAFTRPWRVPQ